MRRAWAVLFLMLPLAVAGQAGSGAGQPATPVPGFQTWSSPELHLTYWYPADLKPVDGAFAETDGRRMLYGEDADSERANKGGCLKTLLSVGNGREGSGGAWTRVGLLEVSGQCFPAKMLKDKKGVPLLLRNLVTQGTTVMGTMPVEAPALYLLEGRRAGFGASQGQPVTTGDVQTADQQLIGVAVVDLEDRLVAWVIETSDASMFNRLLGSGVDFGTGKPERLFPGSVGEGDGAF
ncbi:MAG: hypothetical protein ACLGXA_22800 [Acidobacteriota bacterium]